MIIAYNKHPLSVKIDYEEASIHLKDCGLAQYLSLLISLGNIIIRMLNSIARYSTTDVTIQIESGNHSMGLWITICQRRHDIGIFKNVCCKTAAA